MFENKEILHIKEIIKALADYVMLNSVATDSTSLYYGRAGMSICLFETSRFLNDDYMEDYAFKLLQQSLLNDKKDIRFDAGLSGIGYALEYLIRNKFIDADFFDIFQEQHNIIVDEFLRQEYNDLELKELVLQWQILLYFHYIQDGRVLHRINELHKICIKKFKTEWEGIQNTTISTDKELVNTLWKMYLKVLPFYNENNSYHLINKYLRLLQDGLIKKDTLVMQYISKLKIQELLFNAVDYNITSFYQADSMNIETLFSEPYVSHNIIRTSILNRFNNKPLSDFEKDITLLLGLSPNSAALSSGISRLILGLISINTHSSRITNEIMSVL